MKYFVGYLIQGKTAKWHFNLVKNVSEKFNTFKLHERVFPHITIFRPFETGDIDSIKGILRSWIKNKLIPGDFVISGFDHFGDKVVFAKVEINESVKETVKDLRRTIKRISGMPYEEFPVWRPHVTLANHFSLEEFDKIWSYISNLKKPNFILPFDNVTIFRLENNKKWVIEESLPH